MFLLKKVKTHQSPLMELLMHESNFLSNEVCVPIVCRCWTVSTLIFSSIAYVTFSSISYTSFCLCFWWLFQYKAEDPPEVSQTTPCVTRFPSPPITVLTIQQPLASGTTCVSPLITFSEEFLECVVTVGRICSLLRALSGISAV